MRIQRAEHRYQMTDRNTLDAVPAFEKLDFFQRAYRMSLDVHRKSLEFPKIEQYELAQQLRKATKSVCANIAEGFGKQNQSTAEFRRFLMMAMGSADEVRVWLRYCYDLGYLNRDTWQAWRDEYHAIAKMLQGLHKKSGQKNSDP